MRRPLLLAVYFGIAAGFGGLLGWGAGVVIMRAAGQPNDTFAVRIWSAIGALLCIALSIKDAP